ncbi:MAG TPA: carboxypeptidase-like regulatory domain-containing protein, partial [Segetibacter sp.]
MKEIKNRMQVVLLLWLSSCITTYAQTVVKGVIKDAVTQQPLQSVSVYFRGGKGVTSDVNGAYTLTTNASRFRSVQFSYVGYKTVIKTIIPDKEQVIDVEMELGDAKSSVVVKANKRSRYTNKNNPAVELIRQVIDNKDK